MSQQFMPPEHARWRRVMKYLVALSVNYERNVPMPWRFQPPIQEGEPDFVARFRELEQTVQSEVEQAIVNLIERGEADLASESVRLWLGIRVDACIQFVSLLSTKDGFLTCPCLPTEQLARWILIDWWREHGAEYATAFDPERYP